MAEENCLFSRSGTLWFETAGNGCAGSEALLFSDPLDILTLERGVSCERFFSMLEDKLEQGFFLAGWFSYEVGYSFESRLLHLMASDGFQPDLLAWFGVYREPRRFGTDASSFLARQAGAAAPFALDKCRFDYSFASYARVIDSLRRSIASGDLYQANFTGRYRFSFSGSPLALFMKLRQIQPALYMAYLNTDTRCLLSVSPELFFRHSGGIIETMPMKGTAPRGTDSSDDAEKVRRLFLSEKNRAENLMIVDLLRNDLGRICMPGSVETGELFAVETYPTLHQMVSSVRGRLRDSIGLHAIFHALFPSGSVTGAPKIKAMETIADVEETPRGIYTGSIGFVAPCRDMVFNVAIRTVELSGSEGVYGSGGGIVWDSDPSEEFRECTLKAEVFRKASECQCCPDLFETILWAGGYRWLEEHLERISLSAAVFGISFDKAAARTRLLALESAFFREGFRFRVRLSLSFAGALSIEHASLEVGSQADLIRVCLAGEPICSTDVVRYHKTADRSFHERFYLAATARGFDEVLFLNERGEVAEAAISNVIIRAAGRYYTPPLSSGLLNGIFRAYFLRTRPDCTERTLFVDDLASADAIYLCNSLRGLRRAVFDGSVVSGTDWERGK